MKQFRVTSLLVTDKNRFLKGIVTKEMLEEQFHHEDLSLQDIMKSDVPTVPVGTGVADAVELMRQHGLYSLPVVLPNGILVGLVTNSSLIDALLKQI
jgi:osmoprotectant transport system ATP-binding protein